MTKTIQNNNLNHINFLKHFKILPCHDKFAAMYCFCSHSQSLVELESVIV